MIGHLIQRAVLLSYGFCWLSRDGLDATPQQPNHHTDTEGACSLREPALPPTGVVAMRIVGNLFPSRVKVEVE